MRRERCPVCRKGSVAIDNNDRYYVFYDIKPWDKPLVNAGEANVSDTMVCGFPCLRELVGNALERLERRHHMASIEK